MTSSDWPPTAHPLRVIVQVDDRRLARIRATRRIQARGLHPRFMLRLDPLPEHRARLSFADAPPSRWRTMEEIDWDTAIVETPRDSTDPHTHGGTRSFYYGGGGQAITSAALQRRLSSTGVALLVERAGAGEDRRSLGRLPAVRRITRGEFENAEVSVFVGKNPWMSQSFPRLAALNEIAMIPAGR